MFGAANHPRQPQNMDSLLHLHTKNDHILKNNLFLFCYFFFNTLEIFSVFYEKDVKN